MGDYRGTDGWGRLYQYQSDGDHYTLASFGLNGMFDTPWTVGPINFFEQDIVMEDGAFSQWPEGVQQ